LLTVLSLGLLLAAAPRAESLEPAADAAAAAVLASSPRAGLTIGVAWGRAAFAKGYGLADASAGGPATADAVYPICSISKNFAAAAILKLAESGRLELDAPVARYFVEDPLPGLAVRVRQLLNHTSGAGSYNEGADWSRVGASPLLHDQILRRIASAPHGTPGASWGYSNSAFYVAGLLVERLAGTSYWEYLAKTFFEPLGLRRTGACTAAPKGRARGHRVTQGGLVDAETESWENPFAGGGLCATAGDLLSWQAALDEGKALAPDSVRLMRTPTRLSRGASIDYGLGTRLGELEGHPVVGHTGGGQGFSNVLVRFPKDDLTLVVLTTTSKTQAQVVAARLARRLLGLPAFSPKDEAVPAALASAISGRWRGDDGAALIGPGRDAARMVAQVEDAGPTFPMSFQGDATFAIGEEDLVRFVVEGGRSELALEYIGGLFDSATRRVVPGPQPQPR
jgi:CubicO group peptidase (beta-lactamase class C family)